MAIAAFHGTIIRYNILPTNEVVISRPDREVRVISKETFVELYQPLGNCLAAPVPDTIHYVIWEYGKPFDSYPFWFQQAMYDLYIFSIGDEFYFYHPDGEICMSPRAVILRNRDGELHYIEMKTFHSLYTTVGGNIDEY